MNEIEQIMVLENIQEQYPEATQHIFNQAEDLFKGAVFNGLVFDCRTKRLSIHNPFGKKADMDFSMQTKHRLMPKDIEYPEHPVDTEVFEEPLDG